MEESLAAHQPNADKKNSVTVTRKAGGGERVLSRLVERRMRRAMRGRSAELVGEKQA